MFLGLTKYSKYSPEKRAEIGRHAASTNIASPAKTDQAKFPNLSERTVFNFKKAYHKQKKSSGKEVTIFKTKKRRLPKLSAEIIKKLPRQSSLYDLKMHPSDTM